MTKTNIVLNSIFALCLMTGMFLFFNDHIIGITRSSRLPFFNVTGFQQEYVLLNKKLSVDQIMLSLPGFREAVPNASLLIGDQVDFQTFEKAKKWKFDGSLYYKQLFNQTEDRCQKIKEHFVFLENPLSKEEADFPLAYGFLVYDNAIQIYFLLSAVYQPQNAYCIAVDSKSSDEFKKNLDLLGDCFPNIYVIQVNDVQWYKFSVVRGVWSCIRYLTNLDHAWKYYQYLSGVDLPLKTNLEMVRIFKQLNGTTNIDVNPIPSDRIRLVKNMDWPLQLYKSSLSGLLSRQGLSAAMKSERVRDFIIFAQKLECPDEALWSTIFGNPNMLPIPSTFDAKAVLAQLQIEEKAIKRRCTMSAAKNRTIEEPFVLDDYYISRYQVWMWPYSENTNPFCHGKFAHYSCVYGLLDLKNLITRPELVAHKFYLDVEPAAYFVLYEAIRHRALNTTTQAAFRGRVYAQLPFVQMAAGVNISTLQLHINQCRINW